MAILCISFATRLCGAECVSGNTHLSKGITITHPGVVDGPRALVKTMKKICQPKTQKFHDRPDVARAELLSRAFCQDTDYWETVLDMEQVGCTDIYCGGINFLFLTPLTLPRTACRAAQKARG